MGTKVRYTGDLEEFELEKTGVVVKRMKAIEVDSGLAERLLASPDWERPPAGSSAAKRAVKAEPAPDASEVVDATTAPDEGQSEGTDR